MKLPVSCRLMFRTAAGDSFTAAMVAMYDGDNLPQSLRFANRVASLVCTRPGAQSSIPDEEEIRALMQEEA